MRRALPLLVVGLVGCATPPVYYRDNTSMADFDRDIAGCQYEAASSTATYGSGQNTARTMGGAIAQGLATGLGQAMAANNLIALCMRARGYTRGGPSVGGYPALATTTTPEPGYPRPMADPTGAVAAEYKRPISSPAPPISAAPAVAVGLPVESKWLITAEGVAKANSCSPPTVSMTSKGAGQEMFAVACPNGTTLAIRCEADGCRVLR